MKQATRKKSLVKRLRTQKNSGMSLVFAIMLIPIMMFLATSFVDPLVSSYRSAAADQKTLLAKSVANSMFDIALMKAETTGVGENLVDENGDPITFTKDYDFGTATGSYAVYGAAENDVDHIANEAGVVYYMVPSAGAGDAGGDYCSTLEPIIYSGDLVQKQKDLQIDPQPLQNEPDVFEWPCHWNRLKEGETVSIPLYTEDGNLIYNPTSTYDTDVSGITENPGGLNLKAFELKVRAACNPDKVQDKRKDNYMHQICESGERYVLADDVATSGYTVIVLWEITGINMNNKRVSYGPWFLDVNPLSWNTNFFTTSIANYTNGRGMPYTLTEASFTEMPDKTFEPGIVQSNEFLKNLHKPVLNLTVVHSLRNAADINEIVPYVEYQFRAPVETFSSPITSTSKVVRIQVMIDGGYSETIEKNISLPKPISGFVIK